MMRKILFRGKRIDNGEWVFGDLSQYTGPEPDAIEICFPIRVEDEDFNLHDDFDYAQVDPATVGQYTGLKDKNGQWIWEGDIIDASGQWWDASGPGGHDSPYIAVEWNDEHCGFDPFADYDCDCGVYIYAADSKSSATFTTTPN